MKPESNGSQLYSLSIFMYVVRNRLNLYFGLYFQLIVRWSTHTDIQIRRFPEVRIIGALLYFVFFCLYACGHDKFIIPESCCLRCGTPDWSIAHRIWSIFSVHCKWRKRVRGWDRILTHYCNRYKVQSASKSALQLCDTQFTVHIPSGLLTSGVIRSPTSCCVTLYSA
jgi:hypothetical protein